MNALTTCLYAITALTTTLPTFVAANNPTDCATSSGSFGLIAYRYYATGKKCATDSDIGMIEGALYHQLIEIDPDTLTKSQCVEFDEGGSWEGWVLFGRLGEVDLRQYCGPSVRRAKEEL